MGATASIENIVVRVQELDARLRAAAEPLGPLLTHAAWDEARAHVTKIGEAFHEHMWLEESVVFPYVAAGGLLPRRSLDWLEAEHRFIRQALAALADCLERHELARARVEAGELAVLLEPHLERERRVIYAGIATAHDAAPTEEAARAKARAASS